MDSNKMNTPQLSRKEKKGYLKSTYIANEVIIPLEKVLWAIFWALCFIAVEILVK
jgi:hypothetical protein